jgi:YebC/PmpR family DNA-binding regulatory protein
MYEGYGPHGVAVLVEVVTDNRKRSVADVRHALSHSGGNMAEAGSVAWNFHKAAYFVFPAEGIDKDRVFEVTVEAGADDVIISDDDVEIIAPVEAFKSVNDQLHALGIQPDVAGLRMLPNTTVELPGDHAVQVMRLIEHLEELDDVQEVYSNLEVTEEAVGMMETA